MMKHLCRRFKAGLRLSLLVGFTWALAGPAESGQFYERHGVAIDGFDPVAYFEDHKAVKGLLALSHVYKGSTFVFVSPAHLAAFVQAPERFAPQFGGYCAYGVAEGVKAAIAGEIWEVVEGKLYLNHDPQVQVKWKAERSALLRAAQAKWPQVESSTDVYP